MTVRSVSPFVIILKLWHVKEKLEFGNRTIIEKKPSVRKLGNSLAYRLFFRSSLLKHLKLFSNLMRQYQFSAQSICSQTGRKGARSLGMRQLKLYPKFGFGSLKKKPLRHSFHRLGGSSNAFRPLPQNKGGNPHAQPHNILVSGKGSEISNASQNVNATYGFHVVNDAYNNLIQSYVVADFRQTGNPLGDHDIGLFSIIYGLLGHDVPAYLQSNLFENTIADPEFWTWLAMAHALGTAYLGTEKRIMEKSNK
ncbi:unnamed protein product [Malus baccata var. baccata]